MPKRNKIPRLDQRSESGAYCIGCGIWIPAECYVQHRCLGRGLDRKARTEVKRIVARAIADALAAILARMER